MFCAIYPATRVPLRVTEPDAWLIRCALTNDNVMSCDIMLLWQRILFGIVNPSGRAAVSTPVSSAVLPAYYSFKSSGARGGWCDVNDGSSSILWNFGALRCVVQCSYCWRSPVMYVLRLLVRARSFVYHVRVLQSRDTQCCSREVSLRCDRTR